MKEQIESCRGGKDWGYVFVEPGGGVTWRCWLGEHVEWAPGTVAVDKDWNQWRVMKDNNGGKYWEATNG